MKYGSIVPAAEQTLFLLDYETESAKIEYTLVQYPKVYIYMIKLKDIIDFS